MTRLNLFNIRRHFGRFGLVAAVNAIVDNVLFVLLLGDRLGCSASPQERTKEKVVPPEGVVLLDNAAIYEGEPEENREYRHNQRCEDDREGCRS